MSTPRHPYSEPDDDHMLTPSESTDSDELHNRDGDQTVEPPEGWHGADQFGLLEDEAEQGESLDDKLAAEEPDVLGAAVTPETDSDTNQPP
ncbi:hypothetical protein A5630_16375 [Mycolicibacterium mucogenicum]|uniref:Uncharacterized protein n=1 Tax=Mycolicibacterium mucogenicum TaxID=56689 RepID=A0A1A3HA35_MYCMU|nr:hypothetical protein [Mycolicibacterium mucogenicum]OBJ44473.1 hypothetical protein A5630_16375 [Mycolicibacterium mucogenicum]